MHVIDGWSTKKGFDRTATPSSIAGLGEAVSTARLKGALANLEYNENKLRAMETAQQTPKRVLPENLGALERWIQKPTDKAAKERTLPETLGGMERWIQPADTERYQMQQKMQRIQKRLPTLDYLSWGDRGMPRPETYTAENLTDYLPRIEQLAGYPGRPTKDMQNEAKEILKSTRDRGISGSVGDIGNYTPYTSAVESGDTVLANERMRQFSMLDSVAHGKQNAISYGLMDGTGILSLEKAWIKAIGEPGWSEAFQSVENGMQKGAQNYPALSNAAYIAGKGIQVTTLSKLLGMAAAAFGGSGAIMNVIRGALTLGGSEATQNLGDFVIGRITPEQYWTSVERGIRAGGAISGFMQLLPAARRDFQEWFSRRNAETGGGTALTPSTNELEPTGMEEGLEMPEEEYYAAFERGFYYDEDDDFIDPLDTVREPDILIGRSVGAKAANYEVMDLKTGKIYHFVEGTHIQNVETFAGKGVKKPYEKAWRYVEKYGGKASEWQHTKGFGWIATEEGERYVEVHWSQCAGVGKHDFFIKEWLD